MIGHIVYSLFRGISGCIQIIQLVIAAYCIATWVMRPTSQFYVVLRNLSYPFIAPFRRVSDWLMDKIGLRIDLSALIALFVLNAVNGLIWRLYSIIRFIF